MKTINTPSDLFKMGWTSSEAGFPAISTGGAELVLLSGGFRGEELDVMVVGPRKMAHATVPFPLPMSIEEFSRRISEIGARFGFDPTRLISRAEAWAVESD